MHGMKWGRLSGVALALAAGGLLFPHVAEAQGARRRAVRHAVVRDMNAPQTESSSRRVSRADGWEYEPGPALTPVPAELDTELSNPPAYELPRVNSYRGPGDYRLKNYGLGGYGLGGAGLARYGLGSYGQSTMGTGNYGAPWTFSGYSGYAESSSYGSGSSSAGY